MDDSEFEEELYDVASPCDVPSDRDHHNNNNDDDLDEYHGYESDSSGLFVADHIQQPLDDFVDEDDDGLDFNPADNYLDFSDDDIDIDIDLDLALARAEDEDLSDIASVYSPQPDLEALLRDLDNDEAPVSPARIVSESPARSHYDLSSEVDVEELLEAALNRERQFQGLVDDNRRRFNEQLAIQGYSPVHIESDDDSDIILPDDSHSSASDDLFILATPSVSSGSASTATSQSSASSAPHRASRLDQPGPSRRPIELPHLPQNNNHNNHNFPSAIRRQHRLPAFNMPHPQPSVGGVAPRALPRPASPFQPPVANSSNGANPRRRRREPSILLDDDDDDYEEAEDELIMMEYSRARRAPRHQPPPPRNQPNDFIDLTEEPDSPVQAFALPPARPAPQGDQPRNNPRRSNSLNHRAPSLNRSDGSNLPGRNYQRHSVYIDLTEDVEAPPPPPGAVPPPGAIPRHRQPAMAQPRANNNAAAPADDDVSIIGAIHRYRLGGFGLPALPAGNLFRGLFGDPAAAAPAAANQNNHRHAPPPPPHQAPPAQFGVNGLHNAVMQAVMAGHNNPIGLDYRHNGFHGIPHYPMAQPKPDFVPPKPARDGFTRDTGSDDLVPVCASCEEELQYDADESSNQPPAKRARTRKDREEHHFWALVDCGHVYCKSCYENRRPSSSKSSSKANESTNPPKAMNFRQGASAKHILCAVDDCETDVSHKKSWIGLFL